ncbi:hypothetical protein FHW36_104399 [Chitinophaga polysaccharea]|uniref:WG repeat protein n=1 Tax=Chitinophaga polysaccharea TaxID=1293035 RepID=A0A561PRG9_9BACT|nr:DUF6770 family protein [Chitinophaga polysaccharea]TWF40715.1 hypothetical protein FHW36_104399 [Chitinophaga polysaccharea]
MKRTLVAWLLLLLVAGSSKAQTKVFKEVGEGISSRMRTIFQDGTLVGYLLFTELEKADKDSFNYRITIMDENLNDIGLVNFRELKLDLRSVAFEQDVLCLSYMKSNLLGHEIKKRKEIKAAIAKGYMAIFTQFINLNGKILRSNTIKVSVDLDHEFRTGQLVIGNGGLKEPFRVQNIPGKGFACFYGDNRGKYLLVYDTTGRQTWQKRVGMDDGDYDMLISGHAAYFLVKKKHEMVEGGYMAFGFNLDDSTSFNKYFLKDKKGNQLSVLSFMNDPNTGKPFIAGKIINPRRGKEYGSARLISKGAYLGVFTINIDHDKQTTQPIYNYWKSNDTTRIANSKGRLLANKSYMLNGPSFKDYYGNTYFTGSAIKRGINPGMVIAEVLTAPTIFVPTFLLTNFGTRRMRAYDALLLKQSADGKLTFENSIPSAHSNSYPGRFNLLLTDNKTYYTVTSPETKLTHLIITENKNITFYCVDQKKVTRTIPRVKDHISTMIYPAKEGHIMVAEYDKKERSTKYSIEAI